MKAVISSTINYLNSFKKLPYSIKDFNSLEELIAFGEAVNEELIISKDIPEHFKKYITEEVDFYVEIYNFYRE